ncbi:MFS transporter [Rhizobium tumorigenes]|uniref:MFS transporter n=1 Tax=Rhizobium tumorigenes TaxID=2041385 RepID=UPI00241F336D|nr:MFS transporter [Rhizobium tumorigenes]WFS03577.1 MFS transporter [Rhizobium tumorigenes]
MRKRFNLVAAGFALTALSYGLARFAYGLLLPNIREDISMSATAAGWIGGSAFAAYCVGIVFAFLFDTQLGARRIAVLAGLTATLGLGLVATVQSGLGLGVAIALAGLSSGLTSPPLAVAVARCFEGGEQPRANGAINAGTALGIVLSGIVALTFPGRWRELYALFGVIGLAVTIWLWFAMPAYIGKKASDSLAIRHISRKGIGGLCASAFLTGAASTALWTFGANLMLNDFGYTQQSIALAWIILGVAGTIGAGSGMLTDVFGIRLVHRISICFMALALIGLAAARLYTPIGFLVMALFGTSYIVATGTLLLWGVKLYPDRPALGLGLPFLVLAIGQTTGAPVFGTIWELAGSTAAILTFAAIMLSAAIWKPIASVAGAREISPR